MTFCSNNSDMERALTLTNLRGDSQGTENKVVHEPLFSKDGSIIGDWAAAATSRFPPGFRESVPENAQVCLIEIC
jgi:hypothetical protein